MEFAGDVGEGMVGWINEYGRDLRDIRDGTYDGNELAQTEIPLVASLAIQAVQYYLVNSWMEHYGWGSSHASPVEP